MSDKAINDILSILNGLDKTEGRDRAIDYVSSIMRYYLDQTQETTT